MKWFYVIYMLVSAVFMFGTLVYMRRKPKDVPIEAPLKILFAAGGLALAFNAAAMIQNSEHTARILFSLYYCAVDIALLSILSFVRRYTEMRSYNKGLQMGLSFLVDADMILMIINCFKPIVFQAHMLKDRTELTFWQVGDRIGSYYYHILVTMIMASFIIVDLIRKIYHSPRIYKSKYAVIMILSSMVAAVHALYLQFNYKIDYSLMWYAIIAYAVFYYSMVYVPKGLVDRLMYFTIANMQDGVICLDVENHCVHANKNAKVYCCDELDEQVKSWFAENIKSEEECSRWKSERRIEGETRYYQIEYRKMFDVDGKAIGSFFSIHDCTKETNRLFAEKYRATHDALTEIYNKEYFYERVRKTIDKNQDIEYCIVCTDVKNFKIINDVFGVEVGDKLLKRIASSVSFMAKEGWIFGRLTGDRFAVFLPKAEFDENEFLREAAKMSRLSENYVFKIQIHIGVYFIEDSSLRVSVMCDRANLAIKTIKESYQSSVAYYKEELRTDFLNEQKIISEFDLAIRTGQFQAFVQPQVFSDTGRIHGGEVLVRWIHPQTGMIPPYKFIPILEQTGLIGRLDAHMWELACQKLQEWQTAGLTKHYLSVNISQKDFYLMDVYQVMTALVEKYQIPPKNLHLEITETAIMNNPKEQLPLISRLRDYGFMMEIDDFGSGYSSLNTLKDLNADVLKIDMGFLRKTEHQERSRIILKMIVSLAKSLEMEVITEGVETQEQVDFLKDYGCDIFQGYYFAKPMPMREFEMNFLNKTVHV